MNRHVLCCCGMLYSIQVCSLHEFKSRYTNCLSGDILAGCYSILCYRYPRYVQDERLMTPRVFDSQIAVTIGNYGTHIWDLTLADLASDKGLIVSFHFHFPFIFIFLFRTRRR